MQHPERIRPRRPPGTAFGLAVRDLRRTWPVETALGVLSLAIGSAVVGLVVLVVLAFQADLDRTVLGVAIDTRVRPFHVLLATLTTILGAVAAVQVLLVAWISRRHQAGVLKALGWSGGRLAWLVACQGIAMCAGASAISILVVLGAGAALGVSATALAAAVAATIGTALLAGAIAVAGPAVATASRARTLLG
jgi:hypothetical protein